MPDLSILSVTAAGSIALFSATGLSLVAPTARSITLLLEAQGAVGNITLGALGALLPSASITLRCNPSSGFGLIQFIAPPTPTGAAALSAVQLNVEGAVVAQRNMTWQGAGFGAVANVTRNGSGRLSVRAAAGSTLK